MAVLCYGVCSSVEIEMADGREPEIPDVPRGRPVADLSAAVAAALAEPLDYPPLERCFTPADRVALVLDRGMPRAAEITAATVDALVRAGVAPDGIAILQPPPEHDGKAGEGDPCRLIAAPLRRRVTVATHDPTDRRQLAYLAADDSGGAILINRTLHDADVVLSIGCLRAEETAGYFGIHGVVYPTFSDIRTIERFRGSTHECGNNGVDNGKKSKSKSKSCATDPVAEAEHVAWLLGVLFTIQIVPGAGGEVMHVLAGQSDAVRRRGAELYQAVWGWASASPADLVVAAVEGADRQTWENVGRALDAARPYVEEGGAIAVCCELTARPGPGAQHLSDAPTREAALRRIDRRRPADAVVAAQLARALDRNKVYLLSQLEPAVVEELDLIPIANPAELFRLVQQHESCLLLPEAPYVTTSEA